MSQPIDTQRHSAAHILAAAIQREFPNAKFGVGPVVENGFYYDVDIGRAITDQDLAKLEGIMHKIIEENPSFDREEMSLDDGIKLFEQLHQPFKVELLNDLKERGTTRVSEEVATDIDTASPDTVSVYKTGEFTDLCRGPHVKEASEIGAFKLHKVAGAYWRGKEDNPQLQRIYGLCFATQEELDAYLHMLEEAEKRDHRKIGKQMKLFTFSDLVGSGLPLFTPKGVKLRELLTEFVWDLMKPYGYERVWIPHLAKSDLYKTSGHWDKFEDDLFHVSSKKTDDTFVLKPMNCPHHTQIYASQPRSYRDLPLRYSEVTTVYRDENTGQLQGLSRVRSITQDDAHVFCRPDQVEAEVHAMYQIIKDFYAAFDMPLRVRLSTRDPDHPEKFLGSEEQWKQSETALSDIMKHEGITVEEGIGEAAFYGPKLDFISKDSIGRDWQLATIQLDFNQPERFGLEYTDDSGSAVRPVMVHRAILGSVERFTAILIEHYAGNFPVWLSPEQVRVLPVADRHNEFGDELIKRLRESGLRAELDASTESVGKKIRNAEADKVPYMLVVGDKEASGEALTVRRRGEKDQLSLAEQDFIERVATESKTRSA